MQLEDMTPEAIEQAARAQGWVDIDEWRGDDAAHVDARTFLERGAKPAIVDDRLLKMSADLEASRKENAALRGEVKDLTVSFAAFADGQQKNLDEQREARKKQIADEQRTAVEDADTEAFDRLEKERKDLEKAPAAHTAKAPPPAAAPAEPVEFTDWKKDNDWYEDDVELTAYADRIGDAVRRKTGLDPKTQASAFYDAVAQEVKSKYPERFENPKRSQASATTANRGSGEGGGRRTQKRDYDALPAEAKAACDLQIKRSLVESREEYCKYYDWDDE